MKFGDGQLWEYLKAGDGVLDIGANVGEYAVSFARAVGPTGHVVAIEPDEAAAERCRNVPAKYPQVTVLSGIAIARSSGAVAFTRDTQSVRSSRWAANTAQACATVTVDATTIDAAAALVRNLRGIKIDVQGGEDDALDGATDTLTRAEVIWQIEVWPEGLLRAGTSATSLFDRLEAAGLVPMRRTWATVRAQAASLKGQSYLDVVVQHG